MKRLWHIWLIFGLILAAIGGAMAWISVAAVRLQRHEARATREAEVQAARAKSRDEHAAALAGRETVLQENTRLALWRMESALAPLIAREGARPYFVYQAFHPVNTAYTRMFGEIRPGEVQVPSSLLTFRSKLIDLHFQLDAAGRLASPQAPTGNHRDLAEARYVKHELVEQAIAKLAALKDILRGKDLLSRLPAGQPVTAELILTTTTAPVRDNWDNRQTDMQQRVFNGNDFGRRVQTADRNRSVGQVRGFGNNLAPPGVQEGVIKAIWLEDQLLLARRVTTDDTTYIQGCILNWPRIRTWLLAEAADLFTTGELIAVNGDRSEASCSLAALPLRFVPGPVGEDMLPTLPPPFDPGTVPAGTGSDYAGTLTVSLTIAWGCVIVGAIAAAAVLRGALRLSERRGAFVSAVTHELRTPLTTFRLYADMLADGMVTDPDKRQDYLNRLRSESQRLTHLVANVLAYSRLSGPRRGGPLETVTLGEILDRCREHLADRAGQAGMELRYEGGDENSDADLPVRANVTAVEQILMNLTDNACKYAARAENPAIEIALARLNGHAAIRVRDHGPGISPAQGRRLFRPFSKSAHQAAVTAPGVGLGLALSRRLARDMGGDLSLERTTAGGACFVLDLVIDNDAD